MVLDGISISSLLEVLLPQCVIRHSIGVDFEEVNNTVDHYEENSSWRQISLRYEVNSSHEESTLSDVLNHSRYLDTQSTEDQLLQEKGAKRVRRLSYVEAQR